MPRSVTLEVFDPAGAAPAAPPVNDDALEEARLAGYETGYKAGWDDASTAAEAEGDADRREASRNLQAIAFTFHEARVHLLQELAPLLDTVCSRVLPELARDSLGPVVREALMPLISDTLDGAVTLRIHPTAHATVAAALEGDAAWPVEITEDATLAPNQVHIAGAGEERMIDLDGAITRIQTAVRTFFDEASRAPSGTATPTDPSAPPEQEMLRHG
ncbi:flagellar biosynthesis protein [Rhodobaculum claviforme]|uniref:Flagellar assembly protein FliH n=1 Tax=Rhodobaculum claviforme TaxID=1549854 RepID=A0A934TNY1_9RHOB|nr:flagellar biosynthesis protein [Rhodobaculum claviforme]MBK5928548.1 hypothetical protein [Rhodobaculum claviforme]